MSDFDGIQERQEGKSRMPHSMTILFIGLIIFGLGYIYLYSPQTTGWTSADQYQRWMESLKTTAVTPPSQGVTAGVTESAAEDVGLQVYKAECVMCHGEKLKGGIGPALTGPQFIHGGTMTDLVRTISKGTPNGMPAFAKQLGPEKIQAVAHYIYAGHTK